MAILYGLSVKPGIRSTLEANTKLYRVKEHITKLGGEVIDDEEPEDDDEVPPEINIWWDDVDDAYELTEHENCGSFSSEQKREAEEEELRKAAWGDDCHNQTIERSSRQ
ncbi:hypothetical protein APSETT444_006756 [Aspergillus pseudonomiae]